MCVCARARVCVCVCVVCVTPHTYLCVRCIQFASNCLQELTETLNVLLELSQLCALLLVQELLDAAVHGGLVEQSKLEQLTFTERKGQRRREGEEGEIQRCGEEQVEE